MILKRRKKHNEPKYGFFEISEKLIKKIKKTYAQYMMFHLSDPLLIVPSDVFQIIRCNFCVYFSNLKMNYVIEIDGVDIPIIIRNDLPYNVQFLIMSELNYKEEFHRKKEVYSKKIYG